MNTRLVLTILLGAALAAAAATATPAVTTTLAAPSTPTPTVTPAGECRLQSANERLSLTADDIANCVIAAATPTRIRLTVSYTYASALGKQNIWLGADILAGGNRLKWFGYRPAAVSGSSGTATIEITYGQNDPPRGRLTTDQVEFFMYVGGGQIFFRKLFALKHDWQL